MEYKGFVGQTYTLQSQSVDAQRTVNLYPQADETGEGKNQLHLLSTPGLRRWADIRAAGAGPVRGTYAASNGRFFAVVAGNLVELQADATMVATYALPGEVGAGQVSMTDNGLALMIVTGPRGYFFDLTALTVTQMADDVFQGADLCGFINGYFVFNEPGTEKFWITDLYSDTVDPLGFASAEGSPDLLISLLVDHEEIWLFGDTSTEVWYDAGDANFPFAKIQGAFIPHGTAAKSSPARVDNSVMWLGKNEGGGGLVWRANGYAPVRISTHAMEQAIQRYATIADAVGFRYQQDGHEFYVLNFPSGDATWVYDAATNMWHERAYLGTLAADDGNLHRARPNTHSYAFGKHLVGDWETGLLYELTPAECDDDGREVKRLRRAPYISDELKRITFSKFRLDVKTGFGNPAYSPNTDGSTQTPFDPQIILRWSDDGGRSWSNERSTSLGKSGEYQKMVEWRRLGQGRQRIFEVSTAQHGVNLTLINAYLELEGGAS